MKQIINEGKPDVDIALKYDIPDTYTVVRLPAMKKIGEFNNEYAIVNNNNGKDILKKYRGICILNDKGGKFSISLSASDQMHSSNIEFYEKVFKGESIIRNRMIKNYINKRFGVHIEKLSIFKNNIKGDKPRFLITGSFTFFNF